MKRALFALAAFLFLNAPWEAQAGDYATALRAVHRTSVGFTFGIDPVQTLSYTETISGSDGKPKYTATAKQIGMLYRVDEHNIKENLTSSSGFTGNLFWYSDANGITVPMLGDSAKLELTYRLLRTDAVAALPWTFERMDKVHGTDVAVVRVTHDTALPIDLYVDTKTGLYKRVLVDPKGDYEQGEDILEYGSAGSTRIPVKWKTDYSNYTYAIGDVAVGGGVTADALHPPARTASWEFGSADPTPIQLKKDRILVKATVNGVEGLFILDSGADGILISGKFARRAGLAAIGHGEVGGPSIDEKVDVGIAKSISIGGNTLHDARVYFGSQELDEIAPDGLLGFSLLGNAIVTVDFEKSTLAIADPATYDPSGASGIHVVADLSSGSPVVPVKIGSAVTLNALLDTGNPTHMLIPADLPEKYGLHFTGLECGDLDDMTLGPIHIRQPGACLGGMGGRDALMGIGFFRGFGSVTFDYPNSELILTKKTK